MTPDAKLPSHTGPDAAAARARHEIEEEHRLLRDALDRLGRTRDLDALVPQLTELQSMLARHFAREEAADGLLATVEGAAPHKVNQVERLFREHRELLVDVGALAAAARQCLDGPLARVLRGVERITHSLHEHERTETDLFSEAVTEELGASG